MAATAAMACTNFIVGKKASADGSVICSYNADDYGLFIGLCHYPAGKHAKGEMRDIIDWDTHKYIGQIPEAPETYNVIGNINEYQVTIGETTYGGREEMVDTTGGIDYGSLIYLGLQRSKTAREAIKVMTTLAQTYGYCSGGETFTICDPNEAWIMEMQGKGPGSKGVVWVAVRIPDNAISAHANQSRIGKFDMKDKANVLYAKDVVSFARSKGWYTGKDADFNWKNTYAKPDFSGRRFCDARACRSSNALPRHGPLSALGSRCGQGCRRPAVVGHPRQEASGRCADGHARPLRRNADGPRQCRHGGGIWQMPYRPTPLMFEVDGKKYSTSVP
jgi:dipeptidase